VKITRNSCDDFCELSSRYDQPHTRWIKHIKNCQTEKCGRNEVIAVIAKNSINQSNGAHH